MEVSVLVLVISFVILLALSVPIAIAIGVATILTMLFTIAPGPAVTTVAQQMATGINSFTLLAIPFFILSGQLMGKGGIARRLIDFAKVVVGMFPGGLAYVNTSACMFFGAISGSAVAATSAIGGFMIPIMNNEGYEKNFNTAVTVTGSTTGLLIPPSNVLIVYSLASGGVSIAALFIAGYLPGILVGLGLIGVSAIVATVKSYPTGKRIGFVESLRIFFDAMTSLLIVLIYLSILVMFVVAFVPGLVIRLVLLAVLADLAVVKYFWGRWSTFFECTKKLFDAIPSLLLIVIVIGGIIAGYFTATEASAVAVLYSLALSVLIYREVKVRELPEILLKTAETTSIVMLLIGASMAMSWIMSYENIPQNVSAALIGLTNSKIIIMLLINIILLIVGTFMDMTPAILIFTPIFLPVVKQLGVEPLHFGIIMVLNLCIGLCTPPVGSVLFVGCSVAKTNIARVTRSLLPFYAVMVVALLLVTYIPWISLVLPKLFGFYE